MWGYMSYSQKELLCSVGAVFEWKQATQSLEIEKEKLAEQMEVLSRNTNKCSAEYEADVTQKEREYICTQSSPKWTDNLSAGEIDELKQTVKNSEEQITDFKAQLHNLEMDSEERDQY